MSAGKLPEGWVQSELDNILLTIIGGGTPSKAVPEYYQGDIPWMSVKDMNKHTLTDTVDHITNDAVENSSTNIIPAGTPIIATRMSLGKIVTASFDSAINQDLKALFLSSGVDRNFFIHWYRSQARLIESLGTGTTVKGIRLEVLKALSINLPPFFEQKIIAEKLDTLLAQVGNTKARLEQIPQILKRFRQAVLAAAVSGKLTNASRNSHSLIDWYSTNLGALIVDSCNGLAKRQGLNGNEITILRLADFKDAQRIIGNERKIKLDAKEENKYSLADNDILVIRVNGSADLAGRFIEYKSNGDIEGFCDHFIRLRLDSNKIMSRFLTYIANEGEGRFYLRNSLSTSAGQNTINQTSIKGLSFLLPPLEEQHEIVRRVEQLFAYADTIEKQVNNALTRVNSLTQSILAKAFRGELTAQWRAENPELISGENSAAALLEKIKAERAASGGKKASRKKA
ncbi:restriction endonuclease subunit S [Citrobacter sp. FP75]|uniref:restriction endonuclease subunit S n=1 Tax=Citrobacter sp. FP75 TaxID=1852949 RepID=UPI001BCA4BE2|nr:restriction endonuclease subunit S [Citrobacter sp. FP75]